MWGARREGPVIHAFSEGAWIPNPQQSKEPEKTLESEKEVGAHLRTFYMPKKRP